MKQIVLVVAVLLFLSICGKARAQQLTGLQIQSRCKQISTGDVSSFDSAFCAGFITGVMESQTLWEARDKLEKRNHRFRFCLPENSTNGQYLRVFLKYLDNHPEELQKPAAFLLVESLVEGFPCGN